MAPIAREEDNEPTEFHMSDGDSSTAKTTYSKFFLVTERE